MARGDIFTLAKKLSIQTMSASRDRRIVAATQKRWIKNP
jgi:hypothetical protein